MIRQKDVVLSLSDDVMKKTELFMQVFMKSIVAAGATNMNCLCVIPDKVASPTVMLRWRCPSILDQVNKCSAFMIRAIARQVLA